ncbi:hypothetical protein [Alloalcanivorax profundimaris]|uniref:hypothetical protein n=1 Tax=Alloalcanivorax profundimaris TaxID=2735259 RepID=UPI001E2F6AFD|nr:hypothetical protein [Alloalcanivorax profundimaris]
MLRNHFINQKKQLYREGNYEFHIKPRTGKSGLYDLITPSRERALALNKAYKLIVEEQSFLYGRDATLKPAENVFRHINPEEIEPLKPEKRIDAYDIRLDWSEK